MRGDWSADPGLLDRVLALLDATFPGFARAERAARANGLDWTRCSTPFVVEEGGRVVAHVGVLTLPLVVAGREVAAGGVHAVATERARRGRGLATALLGEALAWAAPRHETLVLTAGSPTLYERVGFRVVQEHLFVLDAPPPAGARAWRPLDLADDADRARLHALLDERAPVSATLGAVRDRDVFLFDTAGRELAWFDDLDAVVWMSHRDGVLRLHDVVARSVPRLTELLARIGGPVTRVECEFAPDRIGGPFRAEPWLFDGEEYLMARGPFLPAGVQAALPRSARC